MKLTGEIDSLYTYPIKGLTAQGLEDVSLELNTGFPADRMFGFILHGSSFDPAKPQALDKEHFLMLRKDERLAGLTTHFDPSSWILRVWVQGNDVFKADLSTEQGRHNAEGFFGRMFDLPPEQAPRFTYAKPLRFTDASVISAELMQAVTLINLDSVTDLSRRIGTTVDPLRFRANIYFSGWPPFSEMDMSGCEVRIGGVRAKLTLRTGRCAATEVNLQSIRRDLPIPRLLMQNYGHADMGIYAEVLEGGVIHAGDSITFEGAYHV
ncbi:MOSC domain-containing protein [Neisseriaceae bacterium TC5R-5]|nr:MOSC domain-containing protein [Neisseriaceae bacterium TC5R-5]